MTTASPTYRSAARAGVLNVQLIEDAAQFTALQLEWNDLHANARQASLPQTYAWQRTWWEVFQQGRRLAITCVRDPQGQLLAIAPLYQRTVFHRGVVPLRRLAFLCTGEDARDEIDSDYLGFILRAGHEQAALERVFRYLTLEAPLPWDELMLGSLSADAGQLALVTEVAAAGMLDVSIVDRREGVYVPLTASWAEFHEGMSRKKRKNLRREQRHLEGAGRVGFRWTTDLREFEELWPTLIDLHQRRWAEVGQPGCFASPLFTRFHRRLAEQLAPGGQARLAALSLNDEVVAIRYLFAHGDRLYGYQSGVDPRRRDLSVGKLLMAQLLAAGMAEGFKVYDFLKGVSAHKVFWSNERSAQVTLRVARRGVRTRLREGIELGVRWAKRGLGICAGNVGQPTPAAPARALASGAAQV